MIRSSVGGGTSCTLPDASSTPQSGQKRNSAVTFAPQAGHWDAARAPHAWQNRFPGISSVPQLVQRYLDGDIDVDAFVSHRITLDDVNRGFELMHAQDGIRSVIEF